MRLHVCYTRFSAQDTLTAPLLFLHGWKGTKEVWDKNIKHLSKDFDCIALDLPGFGKSQTPNEIWNLEKYADFINDFIEGLGLDKVILVGKSFGGRIAIYFAYKYPYRLNKLVLVAAAGVEGKSFLTRGKILVAKTFKFALNHFGVDSQSLYKSSLGQALCKVFKISREESIYKLEVKKLVTSLDLSFYCSEIRVPTLIIWGKNDKVLPLKIGKKLHRLIKDSKFVVINGGHNAHVECSDEFNNFLSEFVVGA